MEAPIAYLILDGDFKVEKYNVDAVHLFETDRIKGNIIHPYLHPDSQDRFYFHLKHLAEKKESHSTEIDILIGTKKKHVKLHSNYIERPSDGAPSYRLAIIDETKENEQRKQIEYLSYHDQLTGVYNRHFLNEEIEKLNKDDFLPMGLILADLNGLKLINDTFGHQAGDQMIIIAVNIIKAYLPEGSSIARIGGDEFIILLSNTDELSAKALVKQLEKACESIPLKDLYLSVAFGYGLKQTVDDSYETVFKEAEDRLYRNKLFHHSSNRKGIIDAALASLYEKHPQEQAHSVRVSQLAMKVGEVLGLGESQVLRLKTAGLLHDIGKITLDYKLFEKNLELTPQEKESLKKHVEVGYRLLNSSTEFADVADVVLYHHEYYNGKGYPRGLQEEQIPLESRIIGLCEAYDVVVHGRKHRKGLLKEDAVQYLFDNAGKRFDPALVDVLVNDVLKQR